MFLETGVYSGFLIAIPWRGCAQGGNGCFGASRLGSSLDSMAVGPATCYLASLGLSLLFCQMGRLWLESGWHIVGAH